ncbi:hypothetical protein B484DRAFT_60668 [Ochromonadaceae sp. CCMP2298]|nr:hypothetical protein B484DRAFT_60668 [Ochromonadaceae sp. CCMP2298]
MAGVTSQRRWHSAWTLVVWACIFRSSLSARTVAVSESAHGASINTDLSHLLDVSDARQRYQAQASTTETACTPFSVSQTNSADVNYAVCSIYACAGETIVMTTCPDSAGACTGDTYLKLYTSSAILLAGNDDTCGVCAQIEYDFTLSCQTYELREGCYSTGACSGTTVYYTKTVAAPTAALTHAPSSEPTGQPSSQPSSQPTGHHRDSHRHSPPPSHPRNHRRSHREGHRRGPLCDPQLSRPVQPPALLGTNARL